MKAARITSQILSYITMWMSQLDRIVCSDKCNTNPYLGTFVMYMFVLMGLTRYTMSSMEIIDELDDVYSFMSSQDMGLGVLCLILCLAETIMLCEGIADMVVRFLVVALMVNIMYVMGMFMPVCGEIILIAAAIGYIVKIVEIIISNIRMAGTKQWYDRYEDRA